MRFIALMALVVLLPVAGAAGYFANPDPNPTVSEAIASKLEPVPGSHSEEWVYVVTKGPLRGQSADAGYVAVGLNKAQLRAMGATDGGFYVRDCRLYTTSGDPKSGTDANAVQSCTQREVTKEEVVKYTQSSRSPGLIG